MKLTIKEQDKKTTLNQELKILIDMNKNIIIHRNGQVLIKLTHYEAIELYNLLDSAISQGKG